MRGERPRLGHLQRIFDEAQAVGRSDVSDIIEGTIDGLDMQQRLYPDLYAHHITAALIEAGIIEGETDEDGT